jgi:hypothetical protein
MPKRSAPPLQWRHLAIECFYESRGKMSEAVKLFKIKTEHKCMSRPSSFIARWVRASKQNRPLNKDAPRPGRPWKLIDGLAVKAAESLCQQLQFSSVKEAIAESTVLRVIQQGTGATAQTMMNNMRRVKPSLCQRMEHFYQPLSDIQKDRRLRACRLLTKQPRHYFRRILFIDAAKFWVTLGKGRKVWIDRQQPKTLLSPKDSRANGKKGQPICLAYYAAVNEELGPVYIKLTSGTRGYKGSQLKDHKVSAYKLPFVIASTVIQAWPSIEKTLLQHIHYPI